MVCRAGYSEIMGDEARNVVAGIHHQTVRPARGEVTFLLQPLQHILPASNSCCMVELNGRRCIVDKKRNPVNGDTVLIDMSGMYEWAMIMIQPRRIITDDGAFLMDDLLEDIAVLGVVTHEVTSVYESEWSPI